MSLLPAEKFVCREIFRERGEIAYVFGSKNTNNWFILVTGFEESAISDKNLILSIPLEGMTGSGDNVGETG